jgi:hypothetical protein
VTAVSSSRQPTPSAPRLRVGVSGHRVPPKLPEQSKAPLRALLDRIFAAVVDTAGEVGSARAANTTAAAELVVVSSLAEGADRIVAAAGLAAGFKLQAVLPFKRNEYARDFETPTSRAAFVRLLDRASAVIELDGDGDERPRAYEAAGLRMLATIDLLIAIWDGEVAAGIGGTAEIVDRAISDGIVVVWIEPAKPDSIQISWSADCDRPGNKANPEGQHIFRPADVATVAGAATAILTAPTQ